MVEDGIPAWGDHYRIGKTIMSDPDRPVVQQDIVFEPLVGAAVRL